MTSTTTSFVAPGVKQNGERKRDAASYIRFTADLLQYSFYCRTSVYSDE